MKITFDYDARFSFSIQNEKMYKVVDDFPKITSKNIDIGIHNIQYRLYLDSLKQFEIEDNYE